MKRLAARRLLSISAMLIAGGVWFTGTTRASDNLDFLSAGAIRDTFWDSRLFDGTPGFPGAILWYHNPTGKPSGLSQTDFEARLETAFNTWDAVDTGVAGPPLVPIVNFGGSNVGDSDPVALDGINMVGWAPGGFGGSLVLRFAGYSRKRPRRLRTERGRQ